MSFWERRGRKPSKGRVGATAVVTIRMSDLGAWGADYKMDQIIEQARDTVIDRIRQYEQRNKDVLTVLDVQITAIFTPEEKS